MAYLLIGPGETLNFTCEWSNELEAASPSDSIANSAWAISPSGPSLSDAVVSDTRTTINVSNCTVGRVYRLTNTVETTQGLTAERSISVRCEKR